ncbi:ATP-binding cassette subfamily B protein [Anaerotaenia torta]|uniref:ABC transporter ATP-binding protein n=1 Tax=Anaerotaenia torta TaxID=433293 RepID=UPI003D250D8A
MAPRGDIKKEKPKDAKGTLLRILRYLKEYRYILLLILLLCVGSNILALLGPSLAGKAINEAAAGAGKVNFGRVYHFAGLMLLYYLASSLLNFIINISMMNMGRSIARKMRNDVFYKLMELPVGYFDRNQAGDIISRVSYDVDVVSTSLSTDIVQVMTSIVTVLGSFLMMLIISPSLVLVTLVTIPLAIIYTKYMGKKTRPLFSKRSAQYGTMNGFVEEMFSGQKTILAYARENEVLEDFDKINEGAAQAYYKADFYSSTMGPSVTAINNLGLALIAMLGSFLYMKEIVTIGQISSFILYSRKFSGPINEIANIMNEIYSALAASERVFRLLDEPEEVRDVDYATVLSDVRGDVDLKDVSFGYVPDRPVIKNFSLNAEAGGLIAIVGPTGAGKTTINNLLMRFYDMDQGECLVDEKEIRTLTRSSLRRAYAMVLQDTWVFGGTIFENIAYGKEGATLEEVVEVAKAAKIHSYIMRLPHGYDTVISEEGGNISKGQKQLLTIARAMLYDSKMLILDEATSNVDTTTERQIQKAMRKLMADKTCFVIAHRLSTIQNADRILVLDKGNVVEQGKHEELMAKRGFYYKLYASQFE